MPTTYAHYRFGCDVLNLLEEQTLGDIIKKERPLFDWGVHGPDLCFYYHPLRGNAVFHTGRYYHRMTGHQFFRQQAELLRKYPGQTSDSAPYIAYLLGTLCHYMLDRECHPYVAEKEKDGVSHDAIESHFDRFLIAMDGKNPDNYRVTGHLHPSQHSAALISEFYPEVTPAEFLDAQNGMIRYLNLLVTPPLTRTFLRCAASLRGAGDMFRPLRGDARFDDSNDTLLRLYGDALERYPAMLKQLAEFVRSRTPLGPEFDHTFGKD